MQIILDYKYCVKVNIFRQSITKIKAKIQNNYCLALMAARLPVTAWKPVLMVWTEHLE